MAHSSRTSLGLLAIAAVVLGSSFTGGESQAAAGGAFRTHQALYELSLVKSRGSNAINSARGRILYNFSGSACEGYTSEFRQVSELDRAKAKSPSATSARRPGKMAPARAIGSRSTR